MFYLKGDDLITPVYIPPTKQPSTTKIPGKDKEKPSEKPCDDEDCFEGGSGSGETTTVDGGATTNGASPTNKSEH